MGGLKLSPVEPHRTVKQSRNQTHIARLDLSQSRVEPVSNATGSSSRSHINDGGTFVTNCVQFVHMNLGIFKVLGCGFLFGG